MMTGLLRPDGGQVLSTGWMHEPIRTGSRVHRLLFDTGMTPAGCAGNLRRLGKDPADIEAIVWRPAHLGGHGEA